MALHVASGLGVSAIVRKLIQRGHNVNGYDGSGWTPLQNAAFYGHTKVARELIGAKADMHLKVKDPDRNVLRIAAYYTFRIMMKIFILCSRLTLNAGMGIDEQDCFFEGRTALMLAAQKGHSAVVAELVKAGADVNVKDKNGMTAVLLAWNYDVIHQLGIQDAGSLKHLSKEDCSRILWHACDKGDLDMVQSVIREGCDVDHVHKGQTPVMMATLRGHDRIVKELILANCDVNQHSKGYYSDLRSSLSLGRQFLPSAMIWVGIMVTLFALDLELGVAPPWVNAWTGSVALLAAPVCATAMTLLPVSWRAVLIAVVARVVTMMLMVAAAAGPVVWIMDAGIATLPVSWPAVLIAVVARVVTALMMVAAAAGPVVWIMAAGIATVGLLWPWGLRATWTANVKCLVYIAKHFAIGFVAFVVWSIVMTVAAGALMIVILLFSGPTWLVSFILVIPIVFIVYMLVSTIVIMIREKRITEMVIWFFCIFYIKGPTWSWIEESSDVYNLVVFYFIVWIVNSKAPGATALHYAAGHNHIKCGGLLVEAGADLSAKNNNYWTPLNIGSNTLEDEVKKTLSFAAKRTIAVIGHEECGKTTLIAALVAESKYWWMKIINYFWKVCSIRQRTTGIDPIKFSSQKYGETLFYDFAGQSQYHGPHQSFLEAMMNKPEVSVTLLLLVKAVEEEDIITQQLHHWLQPLAQRPAPSIQVIVIGSFSDQVQSKKETYEKLLHCMQSVRTELHVDLQGPCLLDCRYAESSGINQVRSFLKEVPPINFKSVSYNLHWVLVQLRKAFSNLAVRLDGFQTWREKNADENLPRKLPSLEEKVCQDLSATGHTLFLHNKKHSSLSWLILDLPALLHKVYGTLFSGSQGKVNQFGLLHCSQLTELFPQLDQELIQSVLISLEFCIEVDPLVLKEELLQLTIDEREEGWLYFPALVSAQPCKVFPEDPDPDQFQWMCWQLSTAEKHFISAHLLQTIILRLAANHVFAHNSVRQHCCRIWTNGLSWSSTKGVDIAVQISGSSMVHVVGGSKAGPERLQEYTAAVVQDVIRSITQLSPKLEATPYIVHPYTHTLWEDPKPPQPHLLYPVVDVITCISCGDNYTLSLSPNTSSVPIGQLFGGELPSLSIVQRLSYPGVAHDGELALSQRELIVRWYCMLLSHTNYQRPPLLQPQYRVPIHLTPPFCEPLMIMLHRYDYPQQLHAINLHNHYVT